MPETETIEVDIGDVYADMKRAIENEHGEDAVEADIRTIIEDSLHESYKQL